MMFGMIKYVDGRLDDDGPADVDCHADVANTGLDRRWW